MENNENFDMNDIINPIKDVGNKTGKFFSEDFVNFFKNIFGDSSKYLNILFWTCCMIICLFCCFMSSPAIMSFIAI